MALQNACPVILKHGDGSRQWTSVISVSSAMLETCQMSGRLRAGSRDPTPALTTKVCFRHFPRAEEWLALGAKRTNLGNQRNKGGQH